ncbi:kinase-like domain-containing protein [Baffinella frigidus]|nr:kinase-like domain-containing protein [Cryptophyta sp. CCMP2293]
MEKNMYIQSRWYRSPEVLLGIPATHAIDVWSAGVVLVELFSGFVPFRGDSSFDQMEQIVNAIGGPPPSMRARCEAITLEKLDEISDNATYDFEVSPSATGSRKGRHEEDMEDKPPSSESKHDRFIRALSCVRPLRDGETQQEMEAAVDLASRMLVLEPLDRISSSEAAFHAFLQPPSPKASNAPVPPSPKGISPKKSVKYEDRLALLSLNKGVEKSSGAVHPKP